MIIWLSSYPKSGNTFLRSILSSYFFSKDGQFDFSLLKKIPKFPNKNLFSLLGVDINNEDEIVKNYITVQKHINRQKKNFNFLKTHSGFFKLNNNFFSDQENTLGAVYIVRDPRNVLLSLSNYYSIANNVALEMIINEKFNLKDKESLVVDYVGSWKSHYNSWKFLDKKVMTIRYEDLVSKTQQVILSIFRFIESLIKSKIKIDQKKLLNSINSTKFEKLKSLENEGQFTENKFLEGQSFFNNGLKTNYKTQLDIRFQKIIETNFLEEMKELNYL